MTRGRSAGRAAGRLPFGSDRAGGPFGRCNGVAKQIQSWVTKNFRSTTAGGTKLYDLSQPKAS